MVLVWLLVSSHSYAALPKIVSTIEPIHLLSLALTKGVVTPSLLLQNHSAHHFLPKPSEIRHLKQADLIIAIDAKFERSLYKIFNDKPKASLLYLSKSPALSLIKNNWHYWLNLDNAIIISAQIAKTLQQKDPDNRHIYQNNLTDLASTLKAYQYDYHSKIKTLQIGQLIFLSNAYDYYTKQYLDQAITLNYQHDESLSAKKIYQLKQQLKHLPSAKPLCIVADDKAEIKTIKAILIDQYPHIKGIILSPLRIQVNPLNVKQTLLSYTQLFDNFYTQLSQCTDTPVQM